MSNHFWLNEILKSKLLIKKKKKLKVTKILFNIEVNDNINKFPFHNLSQSTLSPRECNIFVDSI